MRLVLDTNALWHRPLLERLALAKAGGYHGPGGVEVVLPAVAYMERTRQLLDDPERLELWQEELADIGASVEPFGEEEADRAARRAEAVGLWPEDARDYMIASHVRDGQIPVTDDQGPAWEGIARLSPHHAARLVGYLIDELEGI